MSGTKDEARNGAAARKSTPAGRKRRSAAASKKTAGKSAGADTAPGGAQRGHLRAVTIEPVEPAEGQGSRDTAETGAEGGNDSRFKRPDLIEAINKRTALKRSDAKIVLDLVLDELGKALDRNEELVLPPLGKLMVKSRKPDADGPDILTVKIRRPRDAGEAGDEEGDKEAGEAGDNPLADPGEDG